MLNDTEIALVRAMGAALAKHGEAGLATAAEALVAGESARRGRRTKGATGRPAEFYIVEADPWWRQQVQGMAAAVDMVNEFLKEHKERHILGINNARVALSSKGQWMRLVETADGTVALTIRKAKSSEKPK